jgi:hypothetical protein
MFLVEARVVVVMADSKAKAKEHVGKKVKFILVPESTSRCVPTDCDDVIRWFSESEEDSVEISNPDDKSLLDISSRVIALKKAKKVENVKAVSRTEKGKLVRLWLVKK